MKPTTTCGSVDLPIPRHPPSPFRMSFIIPVSAPTVHVSGPSRALILVAIAISFVSVRLNTYRHPSTRPSAPVHPSPSRDLSPVPSRMPSRKRSASEMEGPPVTSYSPAFGDCPEADLVLQSADGVHFAVPSARLRARSTFLDQVRPADAQECKDGHPLLILRYDSAELEVFLRHALPDRFLLDGCPPPMDVNVIKAVLSMFNKYMPAS